MKTETKSALAYRYKDALYLNITAKCPTACEFCIKFSWDYQYRGYNLLLKKEPPAEEILAAVDDPAQYSEIVFCGYGESTYRLDVMAALSKALRARGAKKMRLNTIGLGSLIHGRNIAPELARIVDAVCISLNTPDREHWLKIHRPLPEFRAQGFEAVLDFIKESAKSIPETYATAVELPELDAERFKALIAPLGARVRLRSYLDEYESS